MSDNSAVNEFGEKMYQVGSRHGTDNGWHAAIDLVHARWAAANAAVREAGGSKEAADALYEVYVALADAAPWAKDRAAQS